MKIEVNLSNSTIDFLLLPLSPSFALLLIHIVDFFLVNFSPFLWCARICHVYHEVNSSADQLVNLTSCFNVQWLFHDRCGVSHARDFVGLA